MTSRPGAKPADDPELIRALESLRDELRPFDNGGCEGEYFAERIDELLAAHRLAVESYEEWRVTGSGTAAQGIVWSPKRRGGEDPEAGARAFIARELENVPGLWSDGPHLHRRRVTVTEWEAIEP